MRDKTEEIRDKFVDFRGRNENSLSAMASKLQHAGHIKHPSSEEIDPREIIDNYGIDALAARAFYESQRLDMTEEKISDWASDQEKKKTAYLWAHTQRASGLVSDINPLEENLLNREDLYRLRESIDKMVEIYKHHLEEIHAEIADDSSNGDIRTNAVFEESVEIDGWIEDNIEEIDEKYRGFPNLQGIASSRNLAGYATFAEEVQQQVYDLIQRAPGTKILPRGDPFGTARTVVLYAAGLATTGIVIPLILLITPSSFLRIDIPIVFLQVTEVILFGLSILFSYLIFDELYRFIRRRAFDI